jgi:putative aldouronate transport system substrate-binding protein
MPKVGPYADKQVWNMASIQLTEGRDYNNPEDDYTMFFRNTFNMEWDMISTPFDVWEEKIRVWAGANDLPDYVTYNFNYVDYTNFAEQGLIKKLPDDWKTRWPGLAAAADVSVIGPMLEEKLGSAYGLPKPIFYDLPNTPLSSHASVWIRTDYLDKLDIEVKDVYTTAELMDIAQEMKDSNVSGLAQRFIPIDGSIGYLASFFVGQYNPYHDRFKKMDDGKYEWGARLEETWIGLLKYREAYDRGLLNGDFLSLPDDQAKTNFQTGMSGMYRGEGDVGNATSNVFNFTKNTGIQWKDANTWVTQLTEDGFVRELETVNFWTLTVFSPKIDEKKFERIMDFLNFTTDPEVQLFIRLGFEGEDRDWHRDAAGEMIVHRPKDENDNFMPISQLYLSAGPMYTNATILSDDFGLKNPGIDAYQRSITRRNYEMKQKYGGDKGAIEPTDWFYRFFSAPNFDKISIIYKEEYAKIVSAPGDLRTNYEKWLNENKPLIDRVIGELNAG